MSLPRSSLALSLLLATACAAQANVAYTFDNDAQGFSLTGDGTLAHSMTGGNGHVEVTDTNGNTDVYLSVPLAAVPTDWSGYLGGTISFDAIMANGITPSWGDFGTIRFTAQNGDVVSADLAPDVGNVITEPGLSWKTYSGTLNAATFNQGAPLAAVLANLKSVTLSMEAGSGPVEVVGVDNFKVTAVPEPSSYALALCGLAVVGAGLARRRQA